MELHLQFGYGMMEHCRALIRAWDGGTAILSPRDLTDTQLRNLGQQIARLPSGRALLDPQFYLPHADHDRLRSHAYWPGNYATGTFWQGAELQKLLRALVDLNGATGTSGFIVPGLLTERVDDDWFAIQEILITESTDVVTDRPVIATIALGADAARDSKQIERIIERSESWSVSGYYIVAEHPNGNYLVDDPIWLANLLDLVAALRLRGADVIIGYSNHQMLMAGCVKATALASGTWMNVRSFPPDKFRAPYDEEVRQRTTWYYCPQALSEYKIPFLDIAQRQGVLSSMQPGPGFNAQFSAPLFSGGQPSVATFTEQAAFRHYLESLRTQAQNVVASTFDDTVRRCETMLDDAEILLGRLSSLGVRGQGRDFANSIDASRAALSLLVNTRGPVLRRRWSAI